jgi:flavorubredoxin
MSAASTPKAKIAIVYYSMYGHSESMQPRSSKHAFESASSKDAFELSNFSSLLSLARVLIVFRVRAASLVVCSVATMAKSVAKGIEAAGAEVKVYQVAETLPASVLEKMYAPAKDANVTTITEPAELQRERTMKSCVGV